MRMFAATNRVSDLGYFGSVFSCADLGWESARARLSQPKDQHALYCALLRFKYCALLRFPHFHYRHYPHHHHHHHRHSLRVMLYLSHQSQSSP